MTDICIIQLFKNIIFLNSISYNVFTVYRIIFNDIINELRL